VNAQNLKGETPLITQAMAGTVELLTVLVQSGADVNACSAEGKTALTRIFDRRPPEPELAELLVVAGADVNQIDPWGFSLLDHYTKLFDGIVHGREVDPHRAKFYRDDFVEERAKLIELIKAKGARLVKYSRHPTKREKERK
jgi:ankyrin repeat protein